jgi:hypothetical protein
MLDAFQSKSLLDLSAALQLANPSLLLLSFGDAPLPNVPLLGAPFSTSAHLLHMAAPPITHGPFSSCFYTFLRHQTQNDFQYQPCAENS